MCVRITSNMRSSFFWVQIFQQVDMSHSATRLDIEAVEAVQDWGWEKDPSSLEATWASRTSQQAVNNGFLAVSNRS